MLQSSIPPKFPIPWAASANIPYIRSIPESSQIGIQNGAASLQDGFPPLTFTPAGAGGVPPFGEDFNGILNQITSWNRWQGAGGAILYDAAFQTAIGGYPNGAIVGSLVVPGNYWMSTIDNNATNPDTGGSGWVVPPAMRGTGETQYRLIADTVPGWVILNGTTIGNASSSASQRANADTQFLFTYFWNGFSNTQCPVSGGRGATAAADFAANKTIATFNMQSIGVMGVDGMGGTATGLLAGVPVQSGALTTPGSIVGENLHALIQAELASHSHTFSATTGGMSGSDPHSHTTNALSGNNFGVGTGALDVPETTATINATSVNHTHNVSGTTSGIGSGSGHNTVQRSVLVYWYAKL